MIINLVVITKGAGRVSEVSARFTLDALPGKQMAIDADLNAGLLTPEEAKARRQEVATEADFYGSMDGASKFVKGDAVAGVLILVVNVIGGLILGMVSHGMTIARRRAQAISCSRSATRWSRRCRRCCCRSPPPRSSPASPRHSDLAGQISSQFGSPAHLDAGRGHPRRCSACCPACRISIILPAAGIAGFVAWKLRKTERRPSSPAPAVAARARRSVARSAGTRSPTRMRSGSSSAMAWCPGRRAPRRAADGADHRRPPPAVAANSASSCRRCRVRDDINLAPNTYRIIVAGVVARRGRGVARRDARARHRRGVSARSTARRPRTRPSASTRSGSRRATPMRRSSRASSSSMPAPSSRPISTICSAERRRSVRHGRGADAARRAEGARRAAGRRPDPQSAAAHHPDPGPQGPARGEYSAEGIPSHRPGDRRRRARAAPMPRRSSN